MRGLANLGNTCFLNAAVQCLAHCPPLVAYLRKCKHAYMYGGGNAVLRELGAVVDVLWERCDDDGASSDVVFADTLVQALRDSSATLFRDVRQQDMHEALLCIVEFGRLDALWDLVLGELEVAVTCGHCGARTTHMDPFVGLSVPFADRLDDGLAAHCSSTVSDWLCGKCQHAHPMTRKRMTVRACPEIVFVQVKRFRADGSKIAAHIAFGEELLLADSKYALVAVVEHMGSTLASGHYVARCHVADGVWVEFDDSRTILLPSAAAALDSQAYVLFYVRLPDVPRGAIRRGTLDESDDDHGHDGSEDWVVPQLWWMRFKHWSRVAPVASHEWDGALVRSVARNVAHAYGGRLRSEWERWRRTRRN